MPKEWTAEERAAASARSRAIHARRRAAAAGVESETAPSPPEPDAPLPLGEPEPEQGEAPLDVADVAAERRLRLLGDLDPDAAALFTDAELEAIEREEQQKARAEAKRQAIADIRSIARHQARVENDLVSADTLRSEAEKARLGEPVTFTVRVPNDGSGHRGQAGFRIDGRLYQDGRTYTRPRAEFESLQSTHYRVWLGEIQFRTLDQHKPGNSAAEILAQTMPKFEVARV